LLGDMGVNAIGESPLADATTAVQVLDRVDDVIRELSAPAAG
jgi:hypothetical protein